MKITQKNAKEMKANSLFFFVQEPESINLPAFHRWGSQTLGHEKNNDNNPPAASFSFFFLLHSLTFSTSGPESFVFFTSNIVH